MSPLRRRIRHGVARFLGVLDSEGVVFFQMLVYLHLVAGGAYCAFVAGTVPTTVRNALGGFDRVWIWLCMGVLMCMIGKTMSAHYERRPVRVYNAGLYLQLAGDICAFGAFAGYVLSTWQEEPWGKALIAVWVFGALAECAFFLCWRDIRRIKQAERAVRR